MRKSKSSDADDLAERCKRYLKEGPPRELTDYAPGSMCEIIIAHGAKGLPLDNELREIAEIVVMESGSAAEVKSGKVREYFILGGELVQEILNTPSPRKGKR